MPSPFSWHSWRLPLPTWFLDRPPCSFPLYIFSITIVVLHHILRGMKKVDSFPHLLFGVHRNQLPFYTFLVPVNTTAQCHSGTGNMMWLQPPKIQARKQMLGALCSQIQEHSIHIYSWTANRIMCISRIFNLNYFSNSYILFPVNGFIINSTVGKTNSQATVTSHWIY